MTRTPSDRTPRARGAKIRLADEYDAAQERGEVARNGQRGKAVPDGNGFSPASDIGLTRKQVHEARAIRNGEKSSPGIVEETIQSEIAAGRGPTRAALNKAIAPERKMRMSHRAAGDAKPPPEGGGRKLRTSGESGGVLALQ